MTSHIEDYPAIRRIYNTVMKTETTFFFILLTCASAALQPVHAQTRPQTSRTNPELWRSHQMNQPAAGASEKNDLSNDRIEEIRQLYLEAQRELESKSDSLQPTSPQLNHQMK